MPAADNGESRLNFNIGGQYNLNDEHHILFSAGTGIYGGVKFMSYLGFQWTFGPHHEPEQRGAAVINETDRVPGYRPDTMVSHKRLLGQNAVGTFQDCIGSNMGK